MFGTRETLNDLARDVRLGLRNLRRDRLLAASVTLILALGIGTSVAMFSVLHAVVLRPLPYARPGELVTVGTHLMQQNQWDGTSLGNLADWRAQSRTLQALTFYRRTAFSLATFSGADAPQRAREGLVGPEFFSLLGTVPLVGRTFTPEEWERRDRVVVLSEGLWREQFASSQGAIGRTLTIDGEPHVVLGVMPRTFQLPTSDTRFWRPYSVLPEWPRVKDIRDSDQVEALGRLAPGVRLEDAVAEMQLIAARLRESYPENRNVDVRLAPLADHVVRAPLRRGVWLGFAAVLSLLVIACFNVGGLLLARTVRRRREFAVRTALGAARSRLMRQLLAESISWWALASVGGVTLAYGLIAVVRAYGPRMLPRLDVLALDVPALAVAFGGGFIVVLACGTIPALLVKTDATEAFGTRDPAGIPRRRLQDLLVAGQIAGALALVIAALLLAQSFLRAQGEDPGYPADNLLIVRLDLPAAYQGRPAVAAFFRAAAERLGRLPGVVALGATSDFFIRRNAGQWVTVEGGDTRGPDTRLATEGVTPGYFTAVGITIVEGRDFEERDYQPGAAGVMIVSQSLARRFWPGESAVGKRLVSGTRPPPDGRWNTVVGVIDDIRREGLDVPPILLAFIPAYPRAMDLTIRVASGEALLMPAIRQELRAIDPALAIPAVVSARGLLSERIGNRRFQSQVLGFFAAIALLLSAAGLYASLAYQVGLRTREIGIRSALGAQRQTIVAMVVGRALWLALAGTVAGLALAASSARLLQSLLYETRAISAPSYVSAALLVMVIVTIASWLPAQRAARVSPMTALREE